MKKITLLTLYFLSICFVQSTIGQTQITLTSDQQLIDLLDPDKVIDLSKGYNKVYGSLRSVCESAQKKGHRTLRIKYDAFYRQYRNQEETDRLITSDSEEYAEKMKIISDFAAGFGLGMELPVLSPLELGVGFKNQTGKSGQWVHYKVGNRDPLSGKFNVKLWQQLYWTNNKGKFYIKLKGVKAYAFNEERVPNSMFKAVDREQILALENVEYSQWEIPIPVDDSQMEVDMWDGVSVSGQTLDRARQIEVFCNGSQELKGFDRVLVLLEYEVPEMAYFSPEAKPFLKNLFQRFKDKEINLIRMTNDEPHFQQDWFYFNHHDNGQFSLRYFTEDMGNHYEKQFGIPFEEKDLLFFASGPDINSNSVMGSQHIQYVKGSSRKEIQQTFLFRDNYYKMLNHHLVDMFVEVKAFASKLFGVEDWETKGHASWAESPTIDFWDTRSLHRNAYKYEYTSNYIWGNTVQQASAACYDYFKWGEYLEPTRNDFAELGWVDRNYYAASMATSIGVVNRIPNAYPHFWGVPDEVARRKRAVNNAFGGMPESKSIDLITGHVHRDVDVLILYPMNLVAADDRFGSWMTQYGYCNFITAEKLLELGSVNKYGELIVKDKKYTTLVSLFEPLPNKGLLSLMDKLVKNGGKALWFGPPPIINDHGESCISDWEKLFGVKYKALEPQGQIAVGKRVDFVNMMKQIPPQYILSDFIVDRIYPVEAIEGTSKLAYCDNNLLIGTGKGNALFFGFRPRDDQSASLGYETRTLFEILDKIGAYTPSEKFANINDNTEYVSRHSDYLCTRFPNGATVIVKHYKDHRENWGSGNSRNKKEDDEDLAVNPLPSDSLHLNSFKVNGHEINFSGALCMAFRKNEKNELIAFEGENCKGITIDGIDYSFSNKNLDKIAFAPSLKNENEINLFLKGNSSVNIPLPSRINMKNVKLVDTNGKNVKFKIISNGIQLEVTNKISGHWLTLKTF